MGEVLQNANDEEKPASLATVLARSFAEGCGFARYGSKPAVVAVVGYGFL